MAIYMKFGDIKGTVTASGYADWIELTSFRWGLTREFAARVQTADKRGSHPPQIGDVTITKEADIATPKFFSICASEKLLAASKPQDAEIHFVKTGSGGKAYLKITLQKALLGDFTIDSGGDRPVETITINFMGAIYTAVSYSDSGAPTDFAVSKDFSTFK